jgi:hypothetical protein
MERLNVAKGEQGAGMPTTESGHADGAVDALLTGHGSAVRSVVRSLLLGGNHALWSDGDRLAGRNWFEAAFRMADAEADADPMAWSALGLSGLWLDEHRDTAAVVLVESRLRRALAAVGPQSPLGVRIRARLAGEADHRAGEHAGILAALRQARSVDDPFARAEAASMAHQCLLGPEHGRLRHALAEEVVAQSFRTGRRSDLLTGLLWRTVDRFLDGDPHAERHLSDLRHELARQRHPAVGYVVSAIEVMLGIRAGRLDEAEALATSCARCGAAAGDVDAVGWHGWHLWAIRWYQGRAAEQLPALRELVNSPTLSVVDDSHLAALAVAAAAAGDHRQAASAVARLRRADLGRLPRSGSWLVTMCLVVEAAKLLHDAAAAAAAYELLRPFAHLPAMAGPGVACFGSVEHALGVAALTVGDATQAVTHARAAVSHNLAIGNAPAATLSRARLAQALSLRACPGDSADARQELATATRQATDLAMRLPTYQRPAASAVSRHAVCRRSANRWWIELGDRSTVVDDCVGMRHLAILLANPGAEIPAIQLAAGPGLASTSAAATTDQPLLDEVALRAYKKRLATLRTELDTHHARNDLDRAAKAQAELDWIQSQLRTTTGLGGRPRNFTDNNELARVSVGKAIRRALNRIAAADQAIANELRETITTGLRCTYRPKESRGPAPGCGRQTGR